MSASDSATTAQFDNGLAKALPRSLEPTAQSALPAISGATYNHGLRSAYVYAASDNFSIFKTNEDKFVLIPALLEKASQTFESESLIGLLVKADHDRTYGVLDLNDQEAEYLFGFAFSRSSREFDALHSPTKQ